MLLSTIIMLVYCSCYGHSSDNFSGEKWLDPNYLFKWKTNDSTKSVTLSVEVKTNGWVGFGFSQHGLTNEVDMIIGWVNENGKPVFNDFWINESYTRSLDTSQDWHLISGSENVTHTVLEFHRAYITCDTEHDLEIYVNQFERSNIVYSYGLTDPLNIETIGEPVVEEIYHLNLFFSEDFLQPKETDIEVFDYKLEFTLPPRQENASNSDIYCKLFKHKHNKRLTLIKSQGIVMPMKLKTLNHHVATLQCSKAVHQSVYEHMQDQTFLYKKSPFDILNTQCNQILLQQSILSDWPVTFPSEAGLTIDASEYPYFVVLVHLINPTYDHVNVTAILKMWTTRQKRKFEAKYTSFGSSLGFHSSHWGFIIPPKQTNFKISLLLDTYCIEDAATEKNGIFIFAVLFHSHKALRHEVRHYRNDSIYGLMRYNHYDWRHQPFVTLRQPINLRIGDKLVVTCEYNSINETKSFTSPKEHCVLMTYSYPKSSSLFDESTIWARIPYPTILNVTGLQQIDNFDNGDLDEMVIRKPVQYNNSKLVDFVADNKYRVNDPRQLEEQLISSDMEECCTIHDRSHLTDHQCRMVKKPPGLYKDISSWRVQNSCSADKNMPKKAEPRNQFEWTYSLIQSLKHFKFSFSVFMKSSKLTFFLLI